MELLVRVWHGFAPLLECFRRAWVDPSQSICSARHFQARSATTALYFLLLILTEHLLQ